MSFADVLKWIERFAKFADVASDVVDQFTKKHPELREGPPPDAEDSLEREFRGDRLAAHAGKPQLPEART